MKEIDNAFKSTIAELAAPASLILYAYLSLEPDPSLLLSALLFVIAVLMTVIVYFAFFHLLRLPFSPAFAAYAFPMAVGAGVLMKASERLAEYPLHILFFWKTTGKYAFLPMRNLPLPRLWCCLYVSAMCGIICRHGMQC